MRQRVLPFALGAALVAAAFTTVSWLASGPTPAQAQTPGREAYRLIDVWTGAPRPKPVGHVRQPAGVAIDADGTVYLADADRGQVHVWRGERFVDVFGRKGVGLGEMHAPRGVAVLDGDVLVADSGSGRVQRFRPDGTFVAAWSGFREPWGVATTTDGLILVTDRASDEIVVLDEDGRRLGAIGGPGTEPGRLDQPLGITTWPDGRLAVVDAGNDRVQVLRIDGSHVRTITNATQLPLLDVAALGEDAILVASLRRISHYDTTTYNLRGVSGAPVPGGFSGIGVQPGSTVPTPTIYAALNHDYLTGLRRITSANLYPHQEWLALPGPAGELESPRRIAVGGATVYLLDAWPRLQTWSTAGAAMGQVTVSLASDVAPAASRVVVSSGDAVRLLSGAAEVWTWQPISETVWLAGVASDAGNDRVYAVDLRGQQVHVLAMGGDRLAAWPLDPIGGAGYQSVTDIALRPDGRLLLVNRTQSRLEVREAADGRLSAVMPVQGIPLRAAPDAAGGAFVLTREGWVWRLGPQGDVRAWWDVAAIAPNGQAAPADLAVTDDGRVLVADAAGNRILVFGVDPGAAPPEPPVVSGCTFLRDKRAGPSRIPLGATVDVTLTVSGMCVEQGAEADVVLVLDRSGSMQGAKMEAARAAAITFVGEMDFSVARVGLVLFSTEAELALPLSSDAASVVDAVVTAQDPVGGTDIGEGIQVAAEELAVHGRSGARRVLVVMTDGRPEGHDVDAAEAASIAKASGVRLYTIGFGPDVDPELLAGLASEAQDYFFAPSPAELSGIYTEIARRISGGVVARTMVVTDVVPTNMQYLVGSAVPPVTSVADRVLRWELQDVTGDLTLRYRLRPTQVGTWPTNEEARATYRDGLGVDGQLVFPVPRVEVYAPPAPIYLPLALKHHCRPREKHADIALVLDTSSSMTGDKLAAAKDAALAFVDVLDLPRDQAAVIGFDSTARMATGLTADRDRLRSAIQGLAITPGTVIDAGLRMATDELTSPRANPENNHVLVLLTDGQNNAGRDPVLRAAERARRAGIIVYTVALGADADRSLMRAVAGDPARSFLALSAADLRRIYEQIAGRVGCTP